MPTNVDRSQSEGIESSRIESKGHLSPGAPGVELLRFEARPVLADIVRHLWLARWDLPPGEVSAQRVLAYPTFNLVIMDQDARLYGPDPTLQVRRLVGRGWALGLLLRPAAGAAFGLEAPGRLLGTSCSFEAPLDAVQQLLEMGAGGAALSDWVAGWLEPFVGRVDEQGRLVNRLCEAVEKDETLVRVDELAERFGLSSRSLERLIMGRIGVTPKWLIECRRLQEAATTLLKKSETDLTELALRLGYADYAHFSRRYKEVLGETPDQTRAPRSQAAPRSGVGRARP